MYQKPSGSAKNFYIAHHTTLKSATAYYLFLLYLAFSCKPLTIWLSDVVAHNFFNQQHISQVHHKWGKNHVHYQIAKTSGEEGTEKGAPPVKVIDEIYLPVHYHYQVYNHAVGINYQPFGSTHLPSIPLAIQLPPPKA